MIPRYTCENKPQSAFNQQNPASYQSIACYQFTNLHYQYSGDNVLIFRPLLW